MTLIPPAAAIPARLNIHVWPCCGKSHRAEVWVPILDLLGCKRQSVEIFFFHIVIDILAQPRSLTLDVCVPGSDRIEETRCNRDIDGVLGRVFDSPVENRNRQGAV